MMTLILKFSHWHKKVIGSIGFMDRTGRFNNWLLHALFSIWILASAGSPTHAQVVADGANVSLANVTKNLSGTVTVGTNVSFTRLTLGDNVLLTNSAHGVIGRNATAKSNEVQLLNATARWQMGGDLSVGSSGAGNRLIARNGAFVNNNSGILGNGASSSNNVALITGSGSLWSNRLDLLVGVSGRDNQMIVSNGAAVASRIGSIGGNAGSSNNLVVVTGNGSVWTNHSDLNVGVNEQYNRLIIEDGGWVGDGDGRVGAGVFSDRSEALVTGAGSLWSSRFDLAVGLNSANNRLVVSNGGAVTAGNNGRVGVSSGSTGNVAIVTGAGSLWSNPFELYVGEGSPGNRMEVRDGGQVVSSNSYVGYFGASNVALVTGAGSTWTNRAGMFVGHARPGNQLVVSDGGVVIATIDSILGVNAGANSNLVVVTDSGSRWKGGSMYVGSNGSFNRLVISNGGSATFGSNSFLGYGAASSSNIALVTGSGSVWRNDNSLFVGSDGGGNRLVVSNGARVVNGAGYVGLTGAGNETMATGSGSVLSYDGFLYLGFQESANGNRIVVRDGGQVANLFASIGRNGSSNQVMVKEPGSAWSSTNLLTIGESGSGNRMDVSDSGRLVTSNASIGFGPTANGNTVVVADAGSIWTNLANLIVGESGSGNTLLVSNSATVLSSNLFVGLNSTSANNRVTVNGGTVRAAMLDVRRGTNVLNAGWLDVDKLVLTNRGVVAVVHRFGNDAPIEIRDGGLTTPYPSTIAVAGLAGAVTNVTVVLSNMTHLSASDLDILLVSPAGKKVMLMSDAGAFFNFFLVTLTFADNAAALPNSSKIITGTYRPSDYEPGETMPSPAPAGPYSTRLSSFNGSNPEGVWSLYIEDDASPSAGSLGSWSILTTTDGGPFVDPGILELNGGTLITHGATIDNALPFIVGGPGGVPAVWEARPGVSGYSLASGLIVGNNSSFNQMLIPADTVVSVGTNVILGNNPAASTNNLLHVSGGTLRVLTPNTALDVRGGTNRIDAGLVDVNRLVVTNTRGQFELNGGTLRTTGTTIANGRIFTVGDGASLATLQLLSGAHTFANNLTIATNGSLIGSGVIDGTVTLSPGGRLTPGAPIGRIEVMGSVILQGVVNLQIDKSGGVRTSDQVSASGAIIYGGTLKVTDVGTDILSAGDRFFLFTATPYIGTFTTIKLPALPPGLSWRNNLAVDGSIEVTAGVVSTPGFNAINSTSTNVVFTGTNGLPNANFGLLTATNVELPLSDWVVVLTNHFDALGRFQITNPVTPADRQRYFRLLTP